MPNYFTTLFFFFFCTRTTYEYERVCRTIIMPCHLHIRDINQTQNSYWQGSAKFVLQFGPVKGPKQIRVRGRAPQKSNCCST